MQQSALISIIDDDISVREAINGLIRSLGYRVKVFSSAEEFLNSKVIDDTCCIITDLQMPGLSGLDLQQRLNANMNKIPILFITAFPDDSERNKAIKAGAVGFLSKPFDDHILIECLEKAIGGTMNSDDA